MPFGATWMDLEIIILCELSQRKINILWYHLCTDSKKEKDTNELIYKTETDSLRKLTYGYQKGREEGGGIDWDLGTDMYTLLYFKW